MPAVTTHSTNHDRSKQRQRRRYVQRVQKVHREAAQCKSNEDARDLATSLTQEAGRTASNPVYEPDILASARWLMMVGIVLSGLGLVGLTRLGEPQGLMDVLMQVVCLGCILIGLFLLKTAYGMGFTERLPRWATVTDVIQAHKLRRMTLDDQRPASFAGGEQLATALLILDAAALLFLVLPLMLPNSTPAVHILCVVIGAFVIGHLANHAANSVARAIRKGQLLKLHAAKEREVAPESRAVASALRLQYDSVIGGDWPLQPGFWRCWGGTVVGLSFLLLVTLVLVGLRSLLGTGTESDWLALLLVTVLVLSTAAFAIAIKVRAECLTPAMAQARRLATRWPSVPQFKKEMRADHDSVVDQLRTANRSLRSALAAKSAGHAGLTWPGIDTDRLKLWDLDPTDERTGSGAAAAGGTVRGTVAVKPAVTGSVAGVPGVTPIHRVTPTGGLGSMPYMSPGGRPATASGPTPTPAPAPLDSARAAASGFRPNPDAARRTR